MVNGLLLTNIYRLLTAEDYPIPSDAVIGRNERKGLTQFYFWNEILAKELQSGPCGKQFWRNDGKRNRYTSYLCNRSPEIKNYTSYAQEIAAWLNVDTLEYQISRFSEFLSDRKYRHDILIRRITELMRLARREDPCCCEEIAQHILKTASQKLDDDREKRFQAAWLLTMLFLYCAAGEAMDKQVMDVLREQIYSMEFLLWRNIPAEKSEPNVKFLTLHSGILQDHPLARKRWLGCEAQLQTVRQAVASNGKCLITGIGGSGKTELLRQLLRECEEQKCVDAIAVIIYDGGIARSFVRCFYGFTREDPQESFKKILVKLKKKCAQSRVLLVIDDVTHGYAEDPELEQLLSLDCAVVLTSRRSSLEGFEACWMTLTSAEDGTQIFENDYGDLGDGERQEILERLVSDDTLCHPLTLRLLAGTAKQNGWSVAELIPKLHKVLTESDAQTEQTALLERTYRQLYSYIDIPKEYHKIVELFTLLPRDSYSSSFLYRWFPDIMGQAPEPALTFLTAGGWLEQANDGWSMHPFIAQCLRRVVRKERTVEPFLRKLQSTLLDMGPMDEPEAEEENFCRMCRIYIHIADMTGGHVSGKFMWAYANAAAISEHTETEIAHLEKKLNRMKKWCVDWNDSVEAAYWRTVYRWRGGDAELGKAFYARQRQQRTITDALYFDFCLSAGYFLKYRQQTELAGEMFREVLENAAAPVQKATAYFYMYELTQVTGDYAASARWGRKGADYAKAHPECGFALIFTNLFALGAGSLKYQKDDTLEALNAMKEMLTENSPDWCKAQYATLAGTYELIYGSPKAALEHYLWQKNHILEYQGKCYSYYNALGQIGQVLRRLKRYEEALESYHEILRFAGKNGHIALHQRICCNLSGVYLDMERPADALIYLRDAVAEGRTIGGLPLGEALWSTALAYRQLQDSEGELTALREAVPLLEEAYGLKHPKTQAAQQRLLELSEK